MKTAKYNKRTKCRGLLPLLTLSIWLVGCDAYQYEVLDQEIVYPEEVHIYADCSGSMRGFFDPEYSEASDLIGNVVAEFEKKGIRVSYHSFGGSAQINSYEDFSLRLLDRRFYTCEQNLFSNPFDRIINEDTTFGKSLHIVFTDAVTSTVGSGVTPAAEKARLVQVLGKYASNQLSNISLYQFAANYRGIYYAQPSDCEVRVGDNIDRNYFAISFGHLKYAQFLDHLFLKTNNANNVEHFNAPLNNKVDMPEICNYQLLTGNQLLVDLDFASLGHTYHPVLLDKENKTYELELIDEKGSRLRYQISDFNVESDTFRMHLARGSRPEVWAEIDYDVSREPCNSGTIDHSKTFRLNILTSAFERVYNDQPAFSRRILIKQVSFPIFSAFYITAPHTFWQERGVYWKLWLIPILLSLVTVPLFYFSGWFNDTMNPLGWWLRVLAILAVLIGVASGLLIYGYEETCTHGLSLNMSLVLKQSLINMTYTVVWFFIFSISVKRFNPNLSTVPI